MLVATTPTIEEKIGEDFAELYRESNQYREVEASIIHFSNPPTGSEPLKFASTYALRLAGSVFYLPLETKSCIVEKSTIQCNASTVQPIVSIERTVFYREKAAGMHSPLSYAMAQSIPGWWIWFYHVCPIAWNLRGIITSQLGDVETIIVEAERM
ncbi:hypothetical protein Peur_074188 [Populus x canadensis]